MPRKTTTLVAFLAACQLVGGCVSLSSSKGDNPSFPLTVDDARESLKAMRDDPATLERPLLVLGGFFDPGFGPSVIKRVLSSRFKGKPIVTVTFFECTSFEQCREKLLSTIERELGSKDAEVDIIGISMGGLVAVYSSSDFGDGRPMLNARRIFTYASPLQGAKLANFTPFTFNTMQSNMRTGTPFYDALAAAKRDVEVFSYTRLKDSIVGPAYSALPGDTPWWVPTLPLQGGHAAGATDARILADIAAKLRGEKGYALRPATPLPDDAKDKK